MHDGSAHNKYSETNINGLSMTITQAEEKLVSAPPFSAGKQWISPHIPCLSLDEGTQSRINENRGIIKKYGQIMAEGDWDWEEYQHQIIVLFWDQQKEKLFCGDGHHRIKAARKQALQQILVEIRFGSFIDAKIFNCTANSSHGNRTTNQDKRNQIIILLTSLELLPENDQRRRWSDREIARRIGVDHKTVGRVRRAVRENTIEQNREEILQKKLLQKKRRRFNSLVKLVEECHQDELINLLSKIENSKLLKLKSVIQALS